MALLNLKQLQKELNGDFSNELKEEYFIQKYNDLKTFDLCRSSIYKNRFFYKFHNQHLEITVRFTSNKSLKKLIEFDRKPHFQKLADRCNSLAILCLQNSQMAFWSNGEFQGVSIQNNNGQTR